MDYSRATSAQLVDECRQRGLAVYGNKPALITRLQRHDARTPLPTTESETPMVQIAAGPDTGKDSDSGDDILAAAAAATKDAPPPPPPTPQSVKPTADPRDELLLQMQAELTRLRGIVEANGSGTATAGPGEPASPEAIARAAQGERVFRTEFVMLDGVELGEGLHASLIAQTAAQAHAAGYRTRGGARRVGWGQNEQRQRTAVYEIYARK